MVARNRLHDQSSLELRRRINSMKIKTPVNQARPISEARTNGGARNIHTIDKRMEANIEQHRSTTVERHIDWLLCSGAIGMSFNHIHQNIRLNRFGKNFGMT